MLDFTNPWSFMEELDSWINFVYEIQKRAGFSILDLENMASNSNYQSIQSQTALKHTNNHSSTKTGKLSNFNIT